MVAKLRSILRQTRWSLIAKASIFGVAWFFLPFWVFTIVAIYLYLSSLFRAGRFLFPFFLIYAITWFSSPTLWLALYASVLFCCILGIKDLIFIKRAQVYEIFALLALFLVYTGFFARF